MSKIGDFSRFIQRQRKTPATMPKRAADNIDRSRTGTQPKVPSTSELKSNLRTRIREIDTGTAEGLRKARRVFIETSLAWEFGDAIVLDPGFQELVEKIESDFASSDTLAADFKIAIEGLRYN